MTTMQNFNSYRSSQNYDEITRACKFKIQNNTYPHVGGMVPPRFLGRKGGGRYPPPPKKKLGGGRVPPVPPLDTLMGSLKKF